jgi:CDP-glycerol glycerophosphotransferase
MTARKLLKRVVASVGRRSPAFRRLTERVRASRRRAGYREICGRNPADAKTVVFESYAGSAYSCSPKALYEAMLRDHRFDGHTLIWAFRKPEAYAGVPALGRATIVRSGSREHLAAYARAAYWIVNSAAPAHVVPRDDQVYVQTWHGTPLKRFGCDDPVAGASKRDVEARARRWKLSGSRFTYFLSQSPFASEKLASAFGMDAAAAASVMLESGYPRNDFLHTFSASDVARIKAELGVPEGKRVVLYAPTWRDDQREPGVGYTLELGLDFDRLRRELGDDHVVLFRAHFKIAQSFDFGRYEGFVHDVSGVDDVNELYVISDVLVTDYSSVFFDYGNLERPVVFYMYDLDHYADDLRGFYMDLDELPGPIVRSEDDLAGAVRSADDIPLERRREFRERFAPLDDGHASERVLERVFRAKEQDRYTR